MGKEQPEIFPEWYFTARTGQASTNPAIRRDIIKRGRDPDRKVDVKARLRMGSCLREIWFQVTSEVNADVRAFAKDVSAARRALEAGLVSPPGMPPNKRARY